MQHAFDDAGLAFREFATSIHVCLNRLGSSRKVDWVFC